ncbi:MAG TPA: TetR/AcrR family transcriptional regulator [Anaerolineales bacterium]|nr:TetR/AcrR family transcriptional regulator [Anaerolineales bacterium]
MRNTIIEKAKCLFIEHGYHGLSMREIADAVGVSKPALYYHFKDKEELFCAVLIHGLEEIGMMIDLINSQPITNYEKLCRFMKCVLNQPAEQRAVINLGTQEIRQLSLVSRQEFAKIYRHQFIEKLRTMIQTGIEDGEFRAIDTDIATWGLLGLMYPYLFHNHFSSSALSVDKIDLIISMYMKGIQKG